MKRTIALALALGLCTPVYAAPRNPECSALTRIFKAAISARQKGANKSDMEKLAGMIEDQAFKQKALELVQRAYTDAVFETVQPAAAGAFFLASCK